MKNPLDLYVSLLRKHAKLSLLFVILCFGAISLFAFISKPKYSSSVTLVIKAPELNSEWDILRAESLDTDFEEKIQSRRILEPALRELGFFNSDPQTSAFSISSLLKPLFKNQSEKKELSPSSIASKVDKFKKSLKVERIKHSLVLKITAKAKSPQLAANYANAVAKSYIREMKDKEISQIKSLIGAAELELSATVKSLERQADARKQFLTKQGWDDYLTDLQYSKAQVAALKNSLRFLNSYEEIKSAAPGTTPSADELGLGINEDASLDALNRQLSRADSQLNNVSSRHSSESLGVLQARFEKEWIDSIFKRQVSNVKQRRERLEKQLSLEQKRLQNLMTWEPKARTIDAEITNLEKRYTEILEKKAQAEFSMALIAQSKENDFARLQVLDAAVPPLPINPIVHMGKMLVLAFLAAIVSFFLMPLIFELFEFRPASPEPIPAAVKKPEPMNVEEPVKELPKVIIPAPKLAPKPEPVKIETRPLIYEESKKLEPVKIEARRPAVLDEPKMPEPVKTETRRPLVVDEPKKPEPVKIEARSPIILDRREKLDPLPLAEPLSKRELPRESEPAEDFSALRRSLRKVVGPSFTASRKSMYGLPSDKGGYTDVST